MGVLINLPLVLCTFYLLINFSSTVNASRRPWTSAADDRCSILYFTWLPLTFTWYHRLLIAVNILFNAQWVLKDKMKWQWLFPGDQRGWNQEGQSCRQTDTHRLSAGDLVGLECLYPLHRQKGNGAFLNKLIF